MPGDKGRIGEKGFVGEETYGPRGNNGIPGRTGCKFSILSMLNK
ncbi:unnamed protein product, partial [Adineta steineri]